MNPRISGGGWIVAAIIGSALCAGPVAADVGRAEASRELERPPTWSIPSRADVQTRLTAWLDASAAPAEARAAALAAWGDAAASPDLLGRVMAACAAVDQRCAALVQDPDADREWLAASDVHPFVRDAAKLWLGRECVRLDRFDDGLALLADLDLAAAVDPAALLFHRAACQHWLLEADAAVESLDRLLERGGEIPVRYERVARLLRADIAALEEESLDHIARRMRDVTRRLDQGRAGARTRAVQDGVIESLDKLIAKLEEQQQCQSGGGGGGGGSAGRGGQGKPMDDSRLADGKGPGEVTRRDLGGTDGWGNLPPHQRDEALQQIGREFPAHYREAIEQYFKRLAAGADTP
ncbi:MAG: hypothetical protein ACKOBP_09215 [Planctomycetia bacterium]